jgi:hypothetical protein
MNRAAVLKFMEEKRYKPVKIASHQFSLNLLSEFKK